MLPKPALLLAQKITRLALRIRPARRIAWPLVRRVQRFFGRHDRYGVFQASFDDGIPIWVSLSDFLEAKLFWQGFQEGDHGELELLKSLLRPEHIFLDIGANIGVFTLVAARRLSQGRVYAFEPSQHHLEKLTANLRLNHLNNVVVCPVALAKARSTGSLYVPQAAQGALLNTGRATLYAIGSQAEQYSVETIEVMPLDAFLEEQQLTRVDVIKIDVEGAELDVLEGARNGLERFKPVVLLEVSREHFARAGRSLNELFRFWRELKYELFLIGEGGRLTTIEGPADLRAHQNICCRPRAGGA